MATLPLPTLTRDALIALFDSDTLTANRAVLNRWLARGDGIAAYENKNMDSRGHGHIQFTSFGSLQAQIETSEPPQRMPDIGHQVNHGYQLLGTYRGELL